MNIVRQRYAMRAQVRTMGSYSAHADQKGLLCASGCRKCMPLHGGPMAMVQLSKVLQVDGVLKKHYLHVSIPRPLAPSHSCTYR